jgi:hypothetical protein
MSKKKKMRLPIYRRRAASKQTFNLKKIVGVGVPQAIMGAKLGKKSQTRISLPEVLR